MGAFRRIFKYILPQWPRIVVVVVTALVVTILLSMSFVTIIPLLKVMMGKEGLHGWVDGKACNWKYGISFYSPSTSDFIKSGNEDLIHFLLVTNVKEKSIAKSAGLKIADKIVSVGNLSADANGKDVIFSDLLEALATAKQGMIKIQIVPRNTKELSYETLELAAAADEDYLNKIGWGLVKRAQYSAKLAFIDWMQWAVSFLPRDKEQDNTSKAVVFIILAITLVTIIRCIAKFYQGYLAEKIVQIGENRLREDAFAHAMNLPMSYFMNEKPSDTVSRIVRDASIMGKAVKIMLGKALREPLNAAFMLIIAMFLNWQLTLIFLCGAPMILWLLLFFGKKMKKATTKSLIAASQMLSKLQEAMAGLRVVKVYNQQNHEQESFKQINERLLKQSLKISKVDAATNPSMEVLGMIAGGIALIVGVQWVTSGEMDPEEFLCLLILLGAASEAVRKTSDIWNKIQEANAAAERIFAVLDATPETAFDGTIDLPPLREKLEFKDIAFTYPGSARPVLDKVNLTVKAGHNIAIVGPNGSGKTTLANLIPRFYNPDRGQILIDGQDIRQATLSSLRNQIAMVTQDVTTFNDTIAANIAYGKPNATEEEVINAAKRAFAHEFIEPLPNGYDTMIGEHGSGLSGGQLQRIIIARAILKNPAILIFDEATSQIDADSESKIHKATEEIMRNRTSFIIAHRFSTVVTADVIVVMNQGRIIAQGSHEQLIQTCSLYQSLYETQLAKT